MSKGFAPLSYRQQALLIGYVFLGEESAFIGQELGLTAQRVDLEYKEILATFGVSVTKPEPQPVAVASPVAARSKSKPVEIPKPVSPTKWQPRRFRTIAAKSRQVPDHPCDLTARLMGDPSAAAYERSLAQPAPFRPEPSFTKRV
ncbi:hypothetical protein [Roseibium sp. MB-4]